MPKFESRAQKIQANNLTAKSTYSVRNFLDKLIEAQVEEFPVFMPEYSWRESFILFYFHNYKTKPRKLMIG